MSQVQFFINFQLWPWWIWAIYLMCRTISSIFNSGEYEPSIETSYVSHYFINFQLWWIWAIQEPKTPDRVNPFNWGRALYGWEKTSLLRQDTPFARPRIHSRQLLVMPLHDRDIKKQHKSFRYATPLCNLSVLKCNWPALDKGQALDAAQMSCIGGVDLWRAS